MTILNHHFPFWFAALFVSSFCSYRLGYNDANPMQTKNLKQNSPVPAAVEEEEKEVTTPAAADDDISDYLTKGEDIFLSTAKSLNPVTDKVTDHSYQIMYGRFLLPYYQQNPSMKMLEIGLGCDMNYGPGASVAVWKKLFPEAELWEAEFDSQCVEKHRDDMLKGIFVLTGDQGDDAVLDSWVELSGGNFDVVIDDGGHQNCQFLQKDSIQNSTERGVYKGSNIPWSRPEL